MSDPTRSRILEVMADGIDAARYDHPMVPRVRPRPFNAADASDTEYATRLARAALTAYESHLSAEGMAVVPGWQPIESAPKDGTRIILAWGGTAVTGSYLDNGHAAYPWKGWRVPSLEITPPGAPSAWMPFPEVPAHVS